MTGYSQLLEDIRGFHHQGGGDINRYKMFLEQAHAILGEDGRMGFIVPSGIYSDHGTGELRKLFLEKCRWQWLFGFENREGIFDIHRSFKFNPLIIQKGGQTDVIRTAFMRRDLNDWEHAERFATDYPRERVLRRGETPWCRRHVPANSSPCDWARAARALHAARPAIRL